MIMNVPPVEPVPGDFAHEKLTVEKAENQIAAIIKQLEIDQDIVVKNLSAKALDLTSLDDSRQRLKMRVVIEVERLPGRDW